MLLMLLFPLNCRYHQILRQARHENLSDIAALRFIYQSGFSKNGETVVVYVARNLPASPQLAEKVKTKMFLFIYFTYTMISSHEVRYDNFLQMMAYGEILINDVSEEITFLPKPTKISMEAFSATLLDYVSI